MTPTRSRWPKWVYHAGDEPDYRFSLANERTFLAWIRTALALLAAGFALDVVDLALAESVQRVLAAVVLVAGLSLAVAAFARWGLAERAMRTGRPLPSLGLLAAATLGVVAVATVLALVVR